jgi:hypothetical protein
MFVSLWCDPLVIFHSDTWWNGDDSSDIPLFINRNDGTAWRGGEMRRNPKSKMEIQVELGRLRTGHDLRRSKKVSSPVHVRPREFNFD